MNPLVIDLPSFAPEQYVNPLVPVAHPYRGDVLYAHSEQGCSSLLEPGQRVGGLCFNGEGNEGCCLCP